MKTPLFAIPIIIILVAVIFLHFNKNSFNRSAPSKEIGDSTEILSDKLDATIDTFNKLKPLVQQTIDKIKYYEDLKKGYQTQIDTFYKFTVDSFRIITLQAKLMAANREIARLNGELEKMKAVPASVQSYTAAPKPEMPDDSSIVIQLQGKENKGLQVYLIPYSKEARKYMTYESSCSYTITQNRQAGYYNGVYFFNKVVPGKYLIKICTYYGNYKVIEKPIGKYNVKMEISPPLQ